MAWRLNASANGSEFARAVAQALLAVSWVYFPLELLRRVCRRHGLADSHFDWSQSAIGVLRANLRWTMFAGLAVVFVTTLLYFSNPEHGSDAVERLFFMLGTIILAIILRRILRPDQGVLREFLAANPGSWLARLKLVWYWGCVLGPLVIGGMTLIGYYYTAQQLTGRIYATCVFVMAVQLARALLQRLILLRRRAIAIHQSRQRLEEAASMPPSRSHQLPPEEGGPVQVVPHEEREVDVATTAEQTQRLLRTAMIAASLVGMWFIWVDVLPALRILDRWQLWTTTVPAVSDGATPKSLPAAMQSDKKAGTETSPTMTEVVRAVTVADLGLAILIGIVTFACARNLPGLLEISILRQLPLDKSIRYAITSVVSYLIALVGIVLAFSAISVGWSKIQWLATALTFGLAFGLQEIFANFVAGLILLFERPLRVGDVVTVDDVTGVVSRIRMRATTITNWDRKEYVIPNKEFITGRMLNWTLSDKVNRIIINIGIAYGSDVENAKQLLRQVCLEHPLILDDPPSRVTFEGFGDNSLNLVVRSFLPDLENRLLVIDQLHSAIDQAFRQSGIEIAFPQRDLHLRSIDPSALNGLKGDGSPRAA